MTIRGIDVSKWQGPIDWYKAKDQGVTFAIIRAGSITQNTGVPYEDYYFNRNAEQAPQYMEAIGFYWYFRPQWNPLNQAEYFWNLIKDKPFDIYPTIDMEEHGGLTPQLVHDRVWVFINELSALASMPTMVYTRAGLWNERVKNNDWAQHFPLWVAHWDTDGRPPIIPRDWSNYGKTYTFWQYMVTKDNVSRYGVKSKALDLNVYNGTIEEFRNEFLDADGPDPDPDPDPCDDPEPLPEKIWVGTEINGVRYAGEIERV